MNNFLVAFVVLYINLSSAVFKSVAPVFTPFKSDGSVNYGVIPQYAKLANDSLVDEILLGGSTGEWPSLSTDERISLLDAWQNALKPYPRMSLMWHVGDNDIFTAQKLAEEAEKRKVDSILIVSPCLYKPKTISILVEIFKSIAAKFSGPAYYYHYPAFYGVDFDIPEFLDAIVKEVPTFKGVKYIDTSVQAISLALANHPTKEIYCQSDYILSTLPFETSGSPVYAYQAPFVAKLRTAWNAGDVKSAVQYQRQIHTFDKIIGEFGGKSAARAIISMVEGGVELGAPRLPLEPLTDSQYQDLKKKLEEEKLIG